MKGAKMDITKTIKVPPNHKLVVNLTGDNLVYNNSHINIKMYRMQ